MEDTGIDSKLQSELSEIFNSDKCDRTASHRATTTTTFNRNHHDPATTTTTQQPPPPPPPTAANDKAATTTTAGTMTTAAATGRATAKRVRKGRGSQRCCRRPLPHFL